MTTDNTTRQLYLAGRWIETSDEIAVTNPWDLSTVGQTWQATDSEVETATAAAQQAAAEFSHSPRHVRSHICRCISEGIRSRAEAFAQLITAESGKPIQYARGEVARAITTFSLAADEALRLTGEVLPLDITPASEAYSGFSCRVPRGPVAAIAPFNFPLNLVAHKIAPALASGCPIVLKPAPQTPLTALMLAEVIDESDVPPGVVSILPMAVEVADKMVRDERFRVLSFTGSAKVGWHLKSVCGRKPALLELGGNAPAIVHSDADISHAVDRLIPGSFAASGQVCIKSQRLLIHEDIYNDFMKAFICASREVKLGNPIEPDTIVGPLIDDASAERIEGWIEEARAGGAKILCGGERSGRLIPPTILTNVAPDAKCLTQEIFGPVVTVEAYTDFKDAVARANATEFGLQASVFTFDTRIVDHATRHLEYGGIIINDSPMVRVDNYPYGGTKQSGLGREGVRYAMEEFTEPKVVVTRSMRQ